MATQSLSDGLPVEPGGVSEFKGAIVNELDKFILAAVLKDGWRATSIHEIQRDQLIGAERISRGMMRENSALLKCRVRARMTSSKCRFIWRNSVPRRKSLNFAENAICDASYAPSRSTS